METLFAIALISSVAYVMFRSGKQTGSRLGLGFGAGRRSRGRRS